MEFRNGLFNLPNKEKRQHPLVKRCVAKLIVKLLTYYRAFLYIFMMDIRGWKRRKLKILRNNFSE